MIVSASQSDRRTLAQWVPPRHGPPTWDPQERGWLLTRYADVSSALRSPGFEVSEVAEHVARVGSRSGRDYGSLANLVGAAIMHRNAPYHVQARRFLKRCLHLMKGALAPEPVREAAVEAVAAGLARGRLDAVTDLATRVPLGLITRALGLSYGVGQSAVRSAHVIEIWRRGMPLRVLDRLQLQAREIELEIQGEISAARSRGEGPLHEILELNRSEFGLPDAQVIGLVFFLIYAAVETTSSLVSSLILMLLLNPAQLDKLEQNFNLLDGAISEGLRYTPPVWRPNYRVSAGDVEIGGRLLQAGDIIVLNIEQAHFDPDAYPEASLFDITRRGPPVLAFGAGVHACLGAPLARLEARAAISALLECSRPRLVDSTWEWQDHPVFRRLEHLEIELEPR